MAMEEVYLSYSPDQAQRVGEVREAVQSAGFDVREGAPDRIVDAVFFIGCTRNDELQHALELVRSGRRDRSWLVVLPLDETHLPLGDARATCVTSIGDLMRHLTRREGVQGDAQAQNVYGPDIEIHGVNADADAVGRQNINGSARVGDVVADKKVVITGITSRNRRP